jgi:hypothetical protein
VPIHVPSIKQPTTNSLSYSKKFTLKQVIINNNTQYFLLTIDVEDWFQVENFKPWIPFETWDRRELRVERNVHSLLNLFDSVEVSLSAKGIAQRVEDRTGKEDELENFRRRRIEVFHFHPGSGKDKINPDNPVNPVKKNKNRIQTTFFILGWIAARLPDLVREIHARGHEVASHGYNHELPNSISCEQLQRDLTDSKKLLEDIIGASIRGYRAPNFGVDDDILKTIEACGYQYDSSYNSFGLHGRYGRISLNGNPRCGIAHRIGENFCELPISNFHFSSPLSFQPSACREPQGRSTLSSRRSRAVLPWGGGGYFRLLPFSVFKAGVNAILKKDGAYMFYMHPWEIDPEQPKVDNASYSNKFKHYTNIKKTSLKLSRLVNEFEHCKFITCSRYLASELPSFQAS